MTAILDTSFLFALTDQSDRNHQRVLSQMTSKQETGKKGKRKSIGDHS